MAAAQDGDAAAYGRLLSELLPVVRRMVGRRWPRAEDSEDVVQDVLLTLHSVRHTYDPHRPFLPWLTAIVAHRVADALRRHGRQGGRERALDDVPETFLSVEANTESADAPALRAAVASLPEGQRRAVELVKLKEMSLAEASAASGMTPGALKVAVHRALKSLKAILARDDT
ncbi:MAG: sigma-70 family RNA polymerase sigma factor [Pseudomonadota bacterium]